MIIKNFSKNKGCVEVLNNIYDYLLLGSLFSIWFVVLLNTILVTSGFWSYVKHYKNSKDRILEDLPFVSILIPAHNEAKVIGRTVQSILNLDYDDDRYETIIINDNSKDNSNEILASIKENHPNKLIQIINTDSIIGGKGKSNALNIGLRHSRGEFIVIYDADNTPEKHALRELVYSIKNDDRAGAVIGKFRCRNKNSNFLTKCINLEGLYFQWMAQAGRWNLFKLCTIPGTNYIIRRYILDKIGGWDTKAITEDTEISFRIYLLGYHIRFCPYSTTWEQEPETLHVWFKQRNRWVKGNFYVMFKNYKYLFDKRAGSVRFDLLYYIAIYIAFFLAAVTSDIIFILNFGGFIETTVEGYSLLLWFMAYVLFVLSVQISSLTEQGESSLSNTVIILAMYFTYCKLWAIVAALGCVSFIKDILLKREAKWYKTERF